MLFARGLRRLGAGGARVAAAPRAAFGGTRWTWRGPVIIQRFGATLNLNVHVHALVLDDVCVEDGGILRFHEAMPPPDEEMDRWLETIDRRVHRLLARRGVLSDPGEGSGADPWRARIGAV